MKVCLLLSFWNETDQMLVANIRSAAESGIVDAVVAVDGRYPMFTSPTNRSPLNNHGAIHYACNEFDLECLIYQPTEPSTEVDKRTLMFRLAETITKPEDWLFVLDADTVISECTMTKFELARVSQDVITVAHWDHKPEGSYMTNFRSIFRAQRGITVRHNHYSYYTADGQLLWGSYLESQAPAFDASKKIKLDHLNHLRNEDRANAALAYYNQRDTEGIESGRCRICDKKTKVLAAPTQFKRTDEGVRTTWFEVCEECLPAYGKRSAKKLVSMGLDPFDLKVRVSPLSEPMMMADLLMLTEGDKCRR